MPARGRGRKSKSGVCRSTPTCNQREIAEKEATPEEEPTIHAQNDLEGGHSEDDTQSVQSDFASTDAPKASKKSKPVIDFSPEEEQSMIEWLEANPVLYNKKLNLYKDTAKKEKLWRDKAVEMGKSVDVLKIWYSSLRSRYGKLKKLRSGSGDGELTERDDWVLSNFEFLRPHIYEVQKKTIVSVSIREI
ncbi:uncharacterized protein [Mytilus edulis]|uniref:uncharacterized protein n=1 Tax=Mytilus edulis TaxID=6550 RepID=UPI0039EF5312